MDKSLKSVSKSNLSIYKTDKAVWDHGHYFVSSDFKKSIGIYVYQLAEYRRNNVISINTKKHPFMILSEN